MKKISSVSLLFLLTVMLAGCGNKCEDDGHSYVINKGEAKCSECGEVCVHQFEGENEKMVCKECGYVCEHEFDTVDNKKICKECGYICKHKYDSDGKNLVCKICENTVDKLDYAIGYIKANGDKDKKGNYSLTAKDGKAEYSVSVDGNETESLVIKVIEGSYKLTVTDKFAENKSSYALTVEVEDVEFSTKGKLSKSDIKDGAAIKIGEVKMSQSFGHDIDEEMISLFKKEYGKIVVTSIIESKAVMDQYFNGKITLQDLGFTNVK